MQREISRVAFEYFIQCLEHVIHTGGTTCGSPTSERQTLTKMEQASLLNFLLWRVHCVSSLRETRRYGSNKCQRQQ